MAATKTRVESASFNGNRLVAHAEGLRKRYPPAVTALDGVSFAVRPGEFVAVLGPSGAGKTTLFRCLTGLTRPDRGTVTVAGRDIWQSPRELRLARRELALIFQQFNLIRRLSALENVLVGRLGYLPAWRSTVRRYPRADVEISVRALARVGLETFAWRRADTLSGGQQQRIGIARALAQQPRFILADEPIASLDLKSAEDVMRLLHGIHEQDGIPILVSLHQLEAVGYADRIIGLRRGEIVFSGSPSTLTDAVIQQIYYTDDASSIDGVGTPRPHA